MSDNLVFNKSINWYRKTPIFLKSNTVRELWIREENGNTQNYEVELKLGKKSDLVELKKDILNSVKTKINSIKKSREKIFSGTKLEKVSNCPICEFPSKEAVSKVKIYGSNYVQCPKCSHVFLIKRPSKLTLEYFYRSNEDYSKTYTKKNTAEFRLNTIDAPLLQYLIKLYKRTYNQIPKRILDVGAGGGHFVEACRRIGINADGIELSKSSRKFAKEVWGIELDDRDFIEVASEYNNYDIVSFWGILEHIPNPSQYINVAYNIVTKESTGFIISRTPRWDSFSTDIQALNTDTIIRHLDPVGHIMIYTDASLAELYYRNNFIPAFAWYYGMDAYEILFQVSNRINNFNLLMNSKDLLIELQEAIDIKRFSDIIVLAGVPRKKIKL